MGASVDDVIRISLLGVLGVVTIVAAGAFSRKLGVAAPLILIVVGAVLWLLGSTGRAVGGRRHYW